MVAGSPRSAAIPIARRFARERDVFDRETEVVFALLLLGGGLGSSPLMRPSCSSVTSSAWGSS